MQTEPSTPDCGLKPNTTAKINAVFARYPQIERVTLYGSRAKGNYRPGSDIDLTISSETMTLSQLLKLENALDDLLLPYKIDLSLRHLITNTNLLADIDRVGVAFYERG
jgi:predicted nucleotidyltransferase